MNMVHLVGSIIDDVLISNPPSPKDSLFTPAERVLNEGYIFEEHKIITEDRYILTAWRLPGKIGESPESGWNKPCVMLQHGLFDNS